jgi:hypothetical protein
MEKEKDDSADAKYHTDNQIHFTPMRIVILICQYCV